MEAAEEGSGTFMSLRSYFAEETMGPPENMAYVAARCASLNNVAVGLASAVGNEEEAASNTRRAQNWVGAALQMQAEAMSLDQAASAVGERVADEMASARESYMTLLTGSPAAGSTEAARTMRDDKEVCAIIYEAFQLGG